MRRGRSYADTTDTVVVDPQPRIISNLIVDQTSSNPAAVAVAGDIGADLHLGHRRRPAERRRHDHPDMTGRPGWRFRHRRRYRGVLVRQRHAGRGPVGAVQPVVRVLRPVLRSRPRPGAEGRQRHGLHSAAAGRSALRRGQPDQLHAADAGHQPARPRRHPGRRATTSTSTPTRPRRSSTRTRPTPRIPRTRCSCAPTRSTPPATRSPPAS